MFKLFRFRSGYIFWFNDLKELLCQDMQYSVGSLYKFECEGFDSIIINIGIMFILEGEGYIQRKSISIYFNSDFEGCQGGIFI